LLHLGSTVMLFALLRRATGGAWRSALVAALFALHPLHVEAVAWVGERKEVLGAFLGFVSLYYYVCYARPSGGGRRVAVRNYCWSLFFFICALMSKPMVVTLPVVMLLLDWWPLDRISVSGFRVSEWWRLTLEKSPFFALAFIAGVVTIYAEKTIGAVSSTLQVPMMMRVANALVSSVHYLGQTAWPVDLSIFYPYPKTYSGGWVAVSLLVLLGITVAGFGG
jgi:hypothetical protein